MRLSIIPESVRTLMLHKVQCGELTITLLTSLTGLSKSHLWKFLRGEGGISMDAFKRIVEALDLRVQDLQELDPSTESGGKRGVTIPVASHSAALSEPEIRPSSAETWLSVPRKDMPPRGPFTASWRKSWRRFVGIRIDRDGARSMNRPEYQGAIAVIDRHYSSLRLYDPEQPNLYAIREGNRLALRFIERREDYLIVRPACIEFPARLIKIERGVDPGDFITGRVAFIQHKS